MYESISHDWQSTMSMSIRRTHIVFNIHDKQIDRGNPSAVSDVAQPKVNFALSMSFGKEIYSIFKCSLRSTLTSTALLLLLLLLLLRRHSIPARKLLSENRTSQFRSRFVPMRAAKWSLLNVSFMYINLIYTFFVEVSVAQTRTHSVLAVSDVA